MGVSCLSRCPLMCPQPHPLPHTQLGCVWLRPDLPPPPPSAQSLRHKRVGEGTPLQPLTAPLPPLPPHSHPYQRRGSDQSVQAAGTDPFTSLPCPMANPSSSWHGQGESPACCTTQPMGRD